jgi:insertion element IS1 protein InsB
VPNSQPARKHPIRLTARNRPSQPFIQIPSRGWRTRLYCADDYAVYDVLLPVGQLYTGKNETHGIERDNARQRHWLARFRRRSIVVSKAKRMVDVSIALFARFAGNDRIGGLISMLA